MNTNAPVDLKQLSALLRQGDGPSPKYEEIGASAVVAFKVGAGSTARVDIPSGGEKKAVPRSESGQGERPESVLCDSRTPIESRVVAALGKEPLNWHSLAGQFGHRSVSGALRKAISILLQNEWIECTTPEKPNSRLQKCRLTEKRKRWFQ
jgi:ATP-dependent DNA helicase RecG